MKKLIISMLLAIFMVGCEAQAEQQATEVNEPSITLEPTEYWEDFTNSGGAECDVAGDGVDIADNGGKETCSQYTRIYLTIDTNGAYNFWCKITFGYHFNDLSSVYNEMKGYTKQFDCTSPQNNTIVEAMKSKMLDEVKLNQIKDYWDTYYNSH